jgi:hypothetical protein
VRKSDGYAKTSHSELTCYVCEGCLENTCSTPSKCSTNIKTLSNLAFWLLLRIHKLDGQDLENLRKIVDYFHSVSFCAQEGCEVFHIPYKTIP